MQGNILATGMFQKLAKLGFVLLFGEQNFNILIHFHRKVYPSKTFLDDTSNTVTIVTVQVYTISTIIT